MRISFVSFFMCLAAVLLVSCGKSGSSHDLGGTTYTGVIPCADCSGIAYELNLNKDHIFESSSRYLGKSLSPFTDHGKWELKTDSLLVLGSDSSFNKRMFVVDERKLKLADQEGNAITGRLAGYYTLHQQLESEDKANKKWNSLRNKGIDFRASGSNSSWKLYINMDSMITFKRGKQPMVRLPVPKLKEDEDSKARVLKAEAESASIAVKLYPTGCLDEQSRKPFPFGVTVHSKGQTYRGCGNYLTPKYRLHDFWSLRSIKGSKIADKDFLTKDPALNLDLSNNRFSGNTGCNVLSGDLTINDDNLSFKHIATTKKACHDSMAFESEFLKALDKVDAYKIDKGALKLLNGNKELMTLHRSK